MARKAIRNTYTKGERVKLQNKYYTVALADQNIIHLRGKTEEIMLFDDRNITKVKEGNIKDGEDKKRKMEKELRDSST